MRVIFLGPPGSGKGTYSTRLAEIQGKPHISTGQIFREAVKRGNELGERVKEFLDRGQLVPDNITIKVLEERVKKADCRRGFILDGYPRTILQAEALDRLVDIDVVLNLRFHERILVKKLSARRVCEKCGETYNLLDVDEVVDGVRYDMPSILPVKPGICDRCGGRVVQREDDRTDIIETRLRLYRRRSKPLIEYYKKRGVLEEIIVHLGLDETIPKILEKLKAHKSTT